MLYVINAPGIVYEGETNERAAERDRAAAGHNARVEREMAYAQAPMRSLWPWCRKHAPWLLPEDA